MRVIDANGENLGVLTRNEALNLARERELDLVLISPNQEVPVARIIEWSKFKYSLEKKNKSNTSSSKTKEWWFGTNIEDNDILVKLTQVNKFLKKGGKAKITVKYQRRAEDIDMKNTMDRILALANNSLELVSEVKKEGRNLCTYVKLKK